MNQNLAPLSQSKLNIQAKLYDFILVNKVLEACSALNQTSNGETTTEVFWFPC